MNKEIADWVGRQKIVITGGTGVLGRLLLKRLIELGATDIVVISRNAAAVSGNTACKKKPQVRYISCDILDYNSLIKSFAGRSVVFHFAALKHAGSSEVFPIDYSKINVLGTVNVLEACRRCDIKKILYVSTAHVYGKPQFLPITENHGTKPLSIYAASKLAAEAFVKGYSVQYGIHAIIARLSNLYGPSLEEDTVLGKAVQQVAAKGPIQLQDLRPVRDFIYIDDAINAFLHVCVYELEESCLTVNVSTGQGVSIFEAVSCLSEIAVKRGLPKPEIIEPEYQEQLSLPVLTFSNDLLCKISNWQPQKTLIDGLTKSLHYKLRSINN